MWNTRVRTYLGSKGLLQVIDAPLKEDTVYLRKVEETRRIMVQLLDGDLFIAYAPNLLINENLRNQTIVSAFTNAEQTNTRHEECRTDEEKLDSIISYTYCTYSW